MTKKQVQISLTEDEYERAEKLAADARLTISDLTKKRLVSDEPILIVKESRFEAIKLLMKLCNLTEELSIKINDNDDIRDDIKQVKDIVDTSLANILFDTVSE